MTVKEVIFSAAAMLGIFDEVFAYISGDSEDSQKTDLLLRCFNIVENELALDYLPLYAEEEIRTETGDVEYSAMERSPVRILEVTDTEGNRLDFKVFPKYIKTQPGTLKLLYTYTPEAKMIDEESDYVLDVSVRLFTYGVLAEYSMLTCLFEEAAVWDKKYKEAIQAAYRVKTCERMRSRRWV